ncbi:hypothetical protein EYF80_006044 [Liparis tanakae]|uniref:Uncharacterized protein n=1 Tax=Liparis tanakae TaxID=230148 RepID=A0A4Z2J034_9TELE|nr:hypothetical protein EYF80_006044 [Liparis tanakae]
MGLEPLISADESLPLSPLRVLRRSASSPSDPPSSMSDTPSCSPLSIPSGEPAVTECILSSASLCLPSSLHKERASDPSPSPSPRWSSKSPQRPRGSTAPTETSEVGSSWAQVRGPPPPPRSSDSRRSCSASSRSVTSLH